MSYTKYLRWILIVGLCLVPFVSFIIASGTIIPNMFFPYITGKNFVFRILVELLLLVYVVLALREPAYRPKSSPLMWAVGGFVLWMGLATLFSVDPVKSFWSNFERMDGYITVLHMFALFVIASAVLAAEKWWDRFFNVVIAVAAIQGLDALAQLLHLFGFAPSSQSGARIDTTFGNAIYVAVFMLFAMFITLYMLTRERRSVMMQSLYGIALVLEGMALFYSQTRGALLGVVLGLVVAGVYVAVRANTPEWKTLRMWSMGLLAALVVLAGTFYAIRDTSFVKSSPTLNRIALISLTDTTTLSRFTLWKDMALPGAMEKPIFGWGQENFSFIFNKYYVPSMYNQEQWFDRTHNEFIDWLVAGGIPAFLLYISFFALAAWAIVRSSLNAPEQGILLGLLAAYGFSNLTVFHDLMSFACFFLILAFVHALSWRPLPRYMILYKPVHDHGIAIVAPIAALVLLTGAWFFNAGGLARAQTLLNAIQGNDPATGAVITPEQHLAYFKQSLSYGPLGKQENVEQLFQYASSAVAPSTSVNPDTKQAIYTFTHVAGDALLASRPGDARLELFMSVFLLQFGQYNEALEHLKKAEAVSPDKQQILFQLGTTYLQQGDTTNALAVLKKAFDLDSSYDDARVLYAGALYFAGQKSQADALLTEKFGTVLVDNDRLIQIYTSIKQWDRVIGIWLARVNASPKDTNVLLGLAGAYFQSGDGAKTIEILQKVSQLDPAQAGQMQQIITQIKNGTLKPGQQ
ncbi:MAG TPA: O-antigen ligase family protein [Candidatus Paceibacterota bacterium]|nr:O-antigen ligase family protein [Candidatus Paceibacterota bacterium]